MLDCSKLHAGCCWSGVNGSHVASQHVPELGCKAGAALLAGCQAPAVSHLAAISASMSDDQSIERYSLRAEAFWLFRLPVEWMSLASSAPCARAVLLEAATLRMGGDIGMLKIHVMAQIHLVPCGLL